MMSREPDVLNYLWIRGYCPLQAAGNIGADHFYFHSRWARWQFAVAGSFDEAIQVMVLERPGFLRTGSFGRGDEAGFMPDLVMRNIIKRCAHEYVILGLKAKEQEYATIS